MIEKQCSINGCDRPAFRRTWCDKHYLAWRNTGDPTHTERSVWMSGMGVDTTWKPDGLCRDHPDTALFFDSSRQAEAQKICKGCPVRKRCLDYAINAGCDYGVWGGVNATERAQMKQAS